MADSGCVMAGRDLALLGGKGDGKTMVVRWFVERMGYEMETFPMFKDMTSRDLIQRRATDGQRNTMWKV